MENLPIPVFDNLDQNHMAVVSLQTQLESLGISIVAAKEPSIKREFVAQVDSIEKDIEVLAAVIYEGANASSADIRKVKEIIIRIESYIEEARKKTNSKKTKLLKNA